MSNIDKQWPQQKIAEMEAARDEIPFGLDEGDSNTLAALSIALAAPVVPNGWVLVPKEPTPAMLNAAWVSHGIYHALLIARCSQQHRSRSVSTNLFMDGILTAVNLDINAVFAESCRR